MIRQRPKRLLYSTMSVSRLATGPLAFRRRRFRFKRARTPRRNNRQWTPAGRLRPLARFARVCPSRKPTWNRGGWQDRGQVPSPSRRSPPQRPAMPRRRGGFDITVSNTSNADIPGRITIADTFPPDVKLTTPVLPWSCEPEKAVGTTIPCSHPGPIPANGSLPPLSFTFLPPVGATTVENCATLGAPLPDGIPAPEKPACATIPVPTPVQPAVQPAAQHYEGRRGSML